MAAIAQGLVEQGVRRLVVAGGETAGAVVKALGVKGLRIGPAIDPGVPWTTSLGEKPLECLSLERHGDPEALAATQLKLERTASSRGRLHFDQGQRRRDARAPPRALCRRLRLGQLVLPRTAASWR